jgi:cell division protein FtsI/penicillin-binding protein 2
MRDAVRSGTGRTLASNPIAIAGKTGTAELDGRPSHSWFAGYAPYGAAHGPRIAFVVLVENGGYGARAAAPLAGAIVDLARQLRIIQQEPSHETASSASDPEGH